MSIKKEIVGTLLFRELIAIRTDTLWRMLFNLEQGQLPGVNEEGATGKLDNKGAIFIPGGLIYQDVDDRQVTYEIIDPLDETIFRAQIRDSMQFDNATLLFPDGMAKSVNLDSGFFARAARRIYTYKTAAFKRIRKIGPKLPIDIDSNDIVRSHCPTYLYPPYGSRTRISTCAAIGLTDPHMYFAYCKTEFCLSKAQLAGWASRLNTAQEHVALPNGKVLYPPHVIVCHDTRYKEDSLTGLIRILGAGRFGEFSTVTFEILNNKLLGELRRKKIEPGTEHIFATHNGNDVLGVLRTYSPTNPGKRSQIYQLELIAPQRDLELDLAIIAEQARERYGVEAAEATP
jgi:hypothetical protein